MRKKLDFNSQTHLKGIPQLYSWWVVVKEFLTGPGKWLGRGWSWCPFLPLMRLILFLLCLQKQRGWLSRYKTILEHKRKTNMFKLKN